MDPPFRDQPPGVAAAISARWLSTSDFDSLPSPSLSAAEKCWFNISVVANSSLAMPPSLFLSMSSKLMPLSTGSADAIVDGVGSVAGGGISATGGGVSGAGAGAVAVSAGGVVVGVSSALWQATASMAVARATTSIGSV